MIFWEDLMNRQSAAVNTFVFSEYIYLGIFAVSFCYYFFFSHMLPITDPVESNYALTAREMVLSSDWLSPRIYGSVWFDKPVFFYWLTALSFKLFGFSNVAVRLMPAAFAAMGMVLMYWFLTKVSKKSVALLAMIIMGTSFEYVMLAKLVITDMVFFFFTSAALVFFYLGYINMDGTKRWYYAMYVCLALAVLTKGPIGILLPGLIIVSFILVQRNWAELKYMSMPTGAVIFAGIALPWYTAMYLIYGTEFTQTFLGVHNYLRAIVSEHPKDNVIYYYVVVFVLSMLPWSFLALKALKNGYEEIKAKPSPLIVYSFIWSAAFFVFYTLMATKYLTYTFPILFPMSIITALYIDNLLTSGKTREIIFWAGIPLFLLVLIYSAISFRYLSHFKLVVTIVSFLAILLFTWWQGKGKNVKVIFGLLCLCQLAANFILSVSVLPAIAEDRSGKGIADVISNYRGYRIGTYYFYSTSSVFYSGNVAIKLEKAGHFTKDSAAINWSSKYTMPMQTIAEFTATSPNERKLIIVPEKSREKFLEEVRELKPRLLTSQEGLNYFDVTNKM